MAQKTRQIERRDDKDLPLEANLDRKGWTPPYGDLTDLNRCRVILDSVGGDVLEDIVAFFLSLLDTAATVFERNGDYALGIFSSGWCRTLSVASRELCDADDNADALASGKWSCHESCWTDASRIAIETGEPVDTECHGGLKICAVPIRADNEIIGAINYGYDDPPRDPRKLHEIAEKFGVCPDELRKQAEAYESRPPFLLEVARNHLTTTARLIGEIVSCKRTSNALLRNKEYIESIVDTARTIILVLDTEGRIVRFNRYMEELSGYELKEVVGRDWFSTFLLSEDQVKVRGVFESSVGGTRARGNVNPIVKKDGETRLIEWWDTELKDQEGNVTGILAIGHDITDRIHAEEKEKKLEAQVQHVQKLESLGTLAGGIAHDFNNLLMGIIGNLDLAKDDIPVSSPAFGSVRQAEKAAKRASELCRQLLAYSGRGRFVVESIEINDIVEEMAHLLDVSISKNTVLNFDLAQNLPLVRADATQIRQVIMNLITNASESIGKKSGIVSITTGAMDCDHDYLYGVLLGKSLPEGVYVYVDVTDTGCGMDRETVDKIFEPFFTTKFTGRGLGLAAVLGIVRGHGGAIEVASEVGRGTSIKVLFPATESPRESEREKRVEKSEWRGEGKILLVDDEETVRTVCELMLGQFGFEVITASDGREAVGLFREHAETIRCVLLDLTMPHMDGDSAIREMKRIKPEIPALLMSGYNEQEISGRFAGRKLAGFIQKPFRKPELAAKIREVLEGE